MVVSHNLSYQDGTLRLYLAGGQHLSAEFSAPRLLNGEAINLDLSDARGVRECLSTVERTCRDFLPGLRFQRFTRLDTAVDIAAGPQMPAVISAAMQFTPPHTRNPVRQIFPGETSWIRGRQVSARCYGKARELLHKTRRDPFYSDIIKLAADQGRTRFELETKTKGGLSADSILNVGPQLAQSLLRGFPSMQIHVGGLEAIRQHIEALDVHPIRKSALKAFALDYAMLGEDGMRAQFPKATWFRKKKQFLDHGFQLENVCEWSGCVDFQPVIEQLMAA
jgi:hypothetical protein